MCLVSENGERLNAIFDGNNGIENGNGSSGNGSNPQHEEQKSNHPNLSLGDINTFLNQRDQDLLSQVNSIVSKMKNENSNQNSQLNHIFQSQEQAQTSQNKEMINQIKAINDSIKLLINQTQNNTAAIDQINRQQQRTNSNSQPQNSNSNSLPQNSNKNEEKKTKTSNFNKFSTFTIPTLPNGVPTHSTPRTTFNNNNNNQLPGTGQSISVRVSSPSIGDWASNILRNGAVFPNQSLAASTSNINSNSGQNTPFYTRPRLILAPFDVGGRRSSEQFFSDFGDLVREGHYRNQSLSLVIRQFFRGQALELFDTMNCKEMGYEEMKFKMLWQLNLIERRLTQPSIPETMVHEPGTSVSKFALAVTSHLANFGDNEHTRQLASQYIIDRLSEEVGNLILDRAISMAYMNGRPIHDLNDILKACDEYDLKEKTLKDRRRLSYQAGTSRNSQISAAGAPSIQPSTSTQQSKDEEKKKKNSNNNKKF